MGSEHELDGDAQLQNLLATLFPEEVLRHYQPEDVLRSYGLAELLRHLRELTPAERDEAELGLPPAVRAALWEHLGETPAAFGAVGHARKAPDPPLVHTRLSDLRGLEGFHDVVELMLRQFAPEAVLRGCRPADVLRYYPLARLLCHLANLTPAVRASVEAGVPPALLEVLLTCAQDGEVLRRLDARDASMRTMERAYRTRPRDEMLDALLSVFPPAEVLRRYSVRQLVSHLRKRADVAGTLPESVLEALRRAADGAP